jgi:PleD family two-component response regulator
MLSEALTPAVVLLIHSDPVTWLAGLLSAQGHTVVHVSSAVAALQRVAEEDPDLVIVGDPLEGAETGAICTAIQEFTLGDRPVVVESRTPLDPARRSSLLAAGAWECVTSDPAEGNAEEQLRISAYIRARQATSRERVGLFTDPRTGLYNRIGLSRRAEELGATSFRTHDQVACVVFALNLEPDTEQAMTYCARTIHHEGRVSDIVARLGEREIAVLASHTDADGVVRLAERMAKVLRSQQFLPEGVPLHADLQASYDSVPNAGFIPVRPIEMVAQAATALRARREQGGGPWIRRSGGHPMVSDSPN